MGSGVRHRRRQPEAGASPRRAAPAQGRVEEIPAAQRLLSAGRLTRAPMCTVSFLPTRQGFMLAMNRDEQISRPRALAPRRHWTGLRASLYPSETGGGTWIGTNDAGLTLALINWYAKPQRDRASRVSRGIIIPHLLAADNLADVTGMVAALPLTKINPFRLIAISARERMVREWRWDGKYLTCKRFSWKRRHWFSSGYDEALTNKLRA